MNGSVGYNNFTSSFPSSVDEYHYTCVVRRLRGEFELLTAPQPQS